MTTVYARVKSNGRHIFCSGFIRGGNWNNGSDDGAFTLNLNNTPSNTNNNIGFRCASDQAYVLVLVLKRQNERHTSTDVRPGFVTITVCLPSHAQFVVGKHKASIHALCHNNEVCGKWETNTLGRGGEPV